MGNEIAMIEAMNAKKLAKQIASVMTSPKTYTTAYNDASLNTVIMNNKGWNNGFVSTKEITLKSVKVTTQSTTVTVYIYKINGSTFTLVDTFTNLPVVNNVVNLNNYILPSGHTVFVQFNNGSYNYKLGANTNYQLVSGVVSSSNVTASFDLVYTESNLASNDFSEFKNLPSVGTLLSNLSQIVPSSTSTVINPVVFSSLTTSSTNNSRYYSNGVVGQRGFLKSISFQTTGNTITVLAATVSNGVLTVTNNYGTFTSDKLDANKTLVIDDTKYTLQENEHIFIQQKTGTFYFGYSSSQNAYKIDGDLVTGLKASGVAIGFNVSIGTYTNGTLSMSDINQMKSNIASLQSAVTNPVPTTPKSALKIKSYMKVYGSDLSKASPEFTVIGDKTGNSSAWTYDTANKVVTPTVIGGYDGTNALYNVLKLNKRYECDLKVLKFDVTLRSDTVLNLHMFRSNTSGQIPNESLYIVDIPNKQLKMTTLNSSTRLLQFGTFSATQAIGFNIIDGNTYQIEIEKVNYTFYLRIKDYLTGVISEVKLAGWDAGTQLSYYGFSWGAGTVAPKISNLSVWMPKNPTVAFVGDSITEGWVMHNLTGNNSLPNRFAELARLAIGNSVISAASSGTISDVIEKFTSEYSIYKPQYLFVTIGTNGGVGLNTSANYQQLKTLCDQNGITLILNHIPSATPSSIDYQTINTNIDSVGVQGTKFDVATATSNLPASGANASMFGDGVHPVYSGSIAMYNRILVDVPELLY